ncbi:MAG: hypothetical protein ACKOGA_22540, partial [Planctomycetaceae bacterium]
MVDPVHERLTPRGRGAVSSFLVTGPADWLDLPQSTPRFRGANGQPLAQQPVGAIVFGALSLVGGDAEEVVACRVGPRQFELHCHGGEAVATRVAELLTEAGFPPPSAGSLATGSHSAGTSGGHPAALRAAPEKPAQRQLRLRDLVLRAAT